MSEIVEIYTDGACKGNPGPGGWGVYLSYKGTDKSLFGGEADTTNNRMELQAAIEALKTLKRACEVNLYTDSTYVRKGITEWLTGWKQKNWTNSQKKPVKNADLWRQLDELNSLHKVHWIWVKGHAGNPGNEMADQLANQGVEQVMQRRGMA
ncbi:ribonuclease HI [Gynuella sunshinyii]|uniref:Ribonuclease H n=1 Tax=Gynuella sunshinyii YC6258 TaxID=1445510 RepID=A0A0C5VM79_9GAMM|nr:ribonuclease HI [Gynuella sunshinyii]AJQ95416.1 ribonuclease HI [Gynuella sunshinyii YC6258]